MRHEHLWPLVWRDKPVARNRNAVDFGRVIAEALFPSLKVNCSAERREHHELRKCNARTLRQFLRCLECIWTVCGQSKNERPEDVHPVFLKLAQTLHELLTR